jgi:hypothetical protein
MGLDTLVMGIRDGEKIREKLNIPKEETVVAVIALGYGATQGKTHKIKTAAEVSNCSDTTPQWFNEGVRCVLLAPTAINQQKFHFQYLQPQHGDKPRVKASRLFSLVGYTQMDLGIAKLHFEIGAGTHNFDWE